MILLSKNTQNDRFFKRDAILKKIVCFMICLFVFIGLAPSGLQAQSCTISGDVSEPNGGPLLHAGGVPLDGSAIPFTLPPNCPPTGDVDVINNRGFMIGCNQDCPIAASPTPSDTVPRYNSSCPLFDIRYKKLTSPDDLIFLQYWNECVGSTLPTDFQASYQGFTNQMFCALDANGYPAAPASAGTPLSGLSSILPTETDDIPSVLTALGFTGTCRNRNFNEAELIQADFWVVVPSFVRSLGVQFNGPKDDQALFMVGPSVNQMCATADFISSSGGDQGIERLYYNIPNTATQVCGGTLLRARMYINDIASQFSVGPEFDFGNGFTSINSGSIYPVTSANDDAHPTLLYDEVLTGFQDGDGNIYDSDLNLVPKGCLVEKLDTPPVVCSIDGVTMAVATQNATYRDSSPGVASYDWSVIAGDATINGPNNGSALNIDFGTSNSTLQLRITDAEGCPSICTQEVSINSVICPSLPSVTGGNFCAGTAFFSFTGTANAVINYTLDEVPATITLDVMGMANLPVTASSTLTLVSVAYLSAPTCNQTLSGNASVTVIDPAIASVTGGTFCEATTADFSITGTPNTVVSYKIDGGATMTITLDAMGVATVSVSNTSTLSLVSIAYSSDPNCSQPLSESAGIILDGPTCFTPVTTTVTPTTVTPITTSSPIVTPITTSSPTVTPVYTWSFLDPCNCANPNNITLSDETFLFADFIRVDASQFTNPMVSLSSADANFLDNTGVPINPATATFVSQGGGILVLPFYTRTDSPASFVIEVNGNQQSGSTNACSPCNIIPTLSQWGLLIYGLLILNFFIGILYRKKSMFE